SPHKRHTMRLSEARAAVIESSRRRGRSRGAFPPSRNSPSSSRMARLQALDDKLLRQVIRLRRSPATLLLRALCRLHDPDSLTFLICALWFMGPVGIDVANHAAIALVVTSIVVVIVKRTVRRTRPADEVQVLTPPDRFSFPSGHTAAAFAVAITMFGAIPMVAPALILVAILVGYGRMYLGAHYPIDLLAGV